MRPPYLYSEISAFLRVNGGPIIQGSTAFTYRQPEHASTQRNPLDTLQNGERRLHCTKTMHDRVSCTEVASWGMYVAVSTHNNFIKISPLQLYKQTPFPGTEHYTTEMSFVFSNTLVDGFCSSRFVFKLKTTFFATIEIYRLYKLIKDAFCWFWSRRFWGEIGEPKENYLYPIRWPHTISCTNAVDLTRVALVRDESVNR